jgi:hypothetical protein
VPTADLAHQRGLSLQASVGRLYVDVVAHVVAHGVHAPWTPALTPAQRHVELLPVLWKVSHRRIGRGASQFSFGSFYESCGGTRTLMFFAVSSDMLMIPFCRLPASSLASRGRAQCSGASACLATDASPASLGCSSRSACMAAAPGLTLALLQRCFLLPEAC